MKVNFVLIIIIIINCYQRWKKSIINVYLNEDKIYEIHIDITFGEHY